MKIVCSVLGFQALQYVEAHQKLLDISLRIDMA